MAIPDYAPPTWAAMAKAATREFDQFANWTIAAVAAAGGIIFASLPALYAIADKTLLKWSVLLLAISIGLGALGKFYTLKVAVGIATGRRLKKKIEEEDKAFDYVNDTQEEIDTVLTEPLIWPFQKIARRNVKRARENGHPPEWSWLRSASIATLYIWLHLAFAFVGFTALWLSL
ncbi:hypothetical protein AB4Y64_07820 [Lysobacter sp. TAF61]|uniref:hypothetical protein n=1 Tax=Lysobacter sp. TAF61 TaxID=3233072 RepID=UPI003F99D883